jgi:transcriptional antiterminator NusG
MKGEITVGKKEEGFIAVGSEVEIKDGPFTGFVGVVDKVDSDNEKLTVMVSIFGRMTPVELGFHQITQ